MRFDELRLAFLDFMAGLCMTFNVDWNKELPDDEYCKEKTPDTTGR